MLWRVPRIGHKRCHRCPLPLFLCRSPLGGTTPAHSNRNEPTLSGLQGCHGDQSWIKIWAQIHEVKRPKSACVLQARFCARRIARHLCCMSRALHHTAKGQHGENHDQEGHRFRKERFHFGRICLNIHSIFYVDIAITYAGIVLGCLPSEFLLNRNMSNFKAFPLPLSSNSWGYV